MEIKDRILVVEDEPAISKIVKLYLQREGFTVYTAADGEQAVALVREHRPDLVVMDVKMPKLDGIAAAAEISAERIERLQPPRVGWMH